MLTTNIPAMQFSLEFLELLSQNHIRYSLTECVWKFQKSIVGYSLTCPICKTHKVVMVWCSQIIIDFNIFTVFLCFFLGSDWSLWGYSRLWATRPPDTLDIEEKPDWYHEVCEQRFLQLVVPGSSVWCFLPSWSSQREKQVMLSLFTHYFLSSCLIFQHESPKPAQNDRPSRRKKPWFIAYLHLIA